MNNIGAIWTPEQEEWLLHVIQKRDISYCSEKMGRTEGAIRSRLRKIATELLKIGKLAEEIHDITKLPMDDIQYIIYTQGLANYCQPWDEKQDIWLRKYAKKLGINECATKMERTSKEVENRLNTFALDDINKGLSTETVCSSLGLDIETFTKNLQQQHIKTWTSLEDIDKLENPPYYVVVKGRNTGIYSSWEACKTSTMGIPAKFKKCSTIEEVKEYISQTKTKEQTIQSIQSIQSKHPTQSARQSLPPLSEEQEKVITDLFANKNILLLGSAGTGKTTIIQHISRRCINENIKIGITGTTGTAAILIHGKTLHSFLGIGLGKAGAIVLANTLLYKNEPKARMLQDLKILLIDEVSMLDAELLTKISKFLTIVRKNEQPFGGLNIVFCGDFYQLPPVRGDFAFTSEIWDSLQLKTHILTKIYRQEGMVFQELLERAKIGQLTDEDMILLNNCKNTVFPDDIKPTRLFSVNTQVDRINKEAFDALPERECFYPTLYQNKESKKYLMAIKFPETTALKIGAQVMVTRNSSTDPQIVNGTRGVVMKLWNENVLIKTKYGEKKITYCETKPENTENIFYKYMPLKLAWALTIHKAQGATLDCVELDLGSSIFEKGQAYTALSRVRSLDSLRIIDIKKESFQAHPEVLTFYKNILQK
jgi:ATP-dependent DNA helicase PIF1